MKIPYCAVLLTACCTPVLFAPGVADAADIGANVSAGVGFSSHEGLKYKVQSNTLKLDHLTTFDQRIGFRRPVAQAGNFLVTLAADLSHQSGNTNDFAINGLGQNGIAKFERFAAFGQVTASYHISQFSPYVGVGLGAVSDKISLPLDPDYKANYLAGKAYIGADWHAQSGFGVDIRATSTQRIN